VFNRRARFAKPLLERPAGQGDRLFSQGASKNARFHGGDVRCGSHKVAFAPCIPTRGTKVPAGPDWIHEIKHDGYRLIVHDPLTIDADIHDGVTALPPDERRDRDKVNAAVRDGLRLGPVRLAGSADLYGVPKATE